MQVTRDGGKSWTNVTHNIPTCRPGAPSIPWRRRATTPAPRTSPSIGIRRTIAIRTSTRRTISADVEEPERDDSERSAELRARDRRGSGPSRACCFSAPRTGCTSRSTTARAWQPLQNNLPHVPVYGITVQEHFGDLVLATYGRGFWILDDIAPLRDLTPAGSRFGDAHLFAPRPTYRFRGITPPAAPAYDLVDGRESTVRRGHHVLLEGRAVQAMRLIDILDGSREDGADAARNDTAGDESGLVGPSLCAGRRCTTAHQSDFRIVDEGRAGRPARRRPPVDSRAARHIHGEVDGRRPRAHPAVEGAEGSAFRRHRGRHPRAVHAAAVDSRQHARGRRHGERGRAAAEADDGSRGEVRRRSGEAGGRSARHEAHRLSSRTFIS